MGGHPCTETTGDARPFRMSECKRTLKSPHRRHPQPAPPLAIPSNTLVLLFLLLSCALLTIIALPKGASGQEDIPTVVIIDSYHHGEDWSDEEIAGLMSALQERYPTLVPSIEHLDAKRFPDAQNLHRMEAFLVEKYHGRPVDLVIALDNPALAFILDARDKVFRGVPVVFAGVSDFDPSVLDGQAEITGAIEDHDLGANIELALSLQPGTRQILAVNDYTGTGLAVRRDMEAVIPNFEDRVDIRFTEPLPMAGLLDEIATLPPDSSVMILSFVTDSENRTFPRAQSTELLTSASAVPVYALHENRLGHGIVGGYLLTGEEHGRQAGEIALRVLSGEDPVDMPVEHSQLHPMFDYTQLQRFAISEDLLPAGSVVINKPSSLWIQFRTWFMTAAAAILVEGALILLLVLLWRRSGRAEQALRSNEDQLRQVLNSMEKAIAVYEAVDGGSDFIFVDINEFAEKITHYTIDDLRGRRLSEMFPGELGIGLIAKLRETWQTGRSTQIPLKQYVDNRITLWVENYIFKLPSGKVVAMFEDTFEKRAAELALRESEERFRQIAENVREVFYVYEPAQDRFLYVSPAYEQIWQKPVQDIYDDPLSFTQLVHPDDRMAFQEAIRKEREANEYFNMEFRIVRADGATRWIWSRNFPILDEQGEVYRVVGLSEDITEPKQAEEGLRERQEFLNRVIDQSPFAIWISDAQGTLQLANPALKRFLNLTDEQIVGKYKVLEDPVLERQGLIPLIRTVFEEGRSIHFTCDWSAEDYPAPDVRSANAVSIDATMFPIHNPQGELINVVLNWIDISERKRAEEALRQSQDLLAASQEISKVGGWEYDPAGQLMFWTAETYRIHDMSPGDLEPGSEEHIAKSLECYDEPDRSMILAAFRRCVEQGEPYDLELPFTTTEGRRLWVRTAGQATWNEERIVRVVGTLMDVTERKQAEEALRQSEANLKRAQEIAALGSWTWHTQTDRVEWSDEMYRIFGIDPANFGGRLADLAALTHPNDREALTKTMQSAADGIEAAPVKHRIIRSDGTVRTVWAEAVVVHRDAEGQPEILTGIAQDITERVQSEERINHLNEVLHAIRNVDQLIVHEKDPDVLIARVCQTLVETRGYDSAWLVVLDGDFRPVRWAQSGVGRGFDDWIERMNQGQMDPCCRLALDQPEPVALPDPDSRPTDCALPGERDGSGTLTARLEHHGRTYGLLSVEIPVRQRFDPEDQELFRELAGDIAFALHGIEMGEQHAAAEEEHRKLQTQLARAQRMEAIGRLAGGVAHDFNNMLTVILGYVAVLLAGLTPDDPSYQDMEEIRKAAQRSADLTRQLLAFSRQQISVPQVVDLNEIISHQKRILSRLIGEDISVQFRSTEPLWQVHIDPSQVDQILTNLAVNARDAIAGVGTVTIETANVVLGAETANALDVPPGPYVLLHFQDDGSGMDEETVSHVFEPFFTTKDIGEGTGLGLATVYGIVAQNQGGIAVDTEVGHGTTFRLYFPRLDASHAAAAEAEETIELPSSGHETVLIVEDEQQILRLIARLLRKNGYEVLATSSPDDAIDIARTHDGVIDLLLTDVVMPAMNGRDLQQRINQEHPHVKTLFMSGYTSDVIVERGVVYEDVEFIQKPFALKTLIARVRAVLDSPIAQESEDGHDTL